MNMSSEIIDMRVKARSCTDHPLVYLQKKVKFMKNGERIRIITDKKEIPIGVIEIIAQKHGAKVKVLREDSESIEAEIYK